MPATSTKPSGQRKAKSTEKAPADYLHDALEDLDKAREKATEEVAAGIDAAKERINDARADLTERGDERLQDWRDQLSSATDDALRELGRWAVRAQRSPEALTELSEEIAKRKAQVGA
jgi:hypothetical protein